MSDGGVAERCDILIVGAGAAGLATAIFARRFHPSHSVIVLDGARRPGAKILVSGGSRCNVTNVAVSERDFWGGRRTIVRRVLRAFSPADTVAFFRELGVALHEESDGKLFPNSNRSREVLDALLSALAHSGAMLRASDRVTAVARRDDGFEVTTSNGAVRAGCVVLATGGRSLPKTGSDGGGYALAAALGHTIVPTTPALVPLRLDEAEPMHRRLSGVAHPAALTVVANGSIVDRLEGALLWTHFGVSGPVTLNASRHWHRAQLDGADVSVRLSFTPEKTFEQLDAWFVDRSGATPTASVQSAVATLLPASVAAALLDQLTLDPSVALAHLTREDRRRLVHALVDWPLPVVDSRGFGYAEVTAGGVTLAEIDPATMASRVCPGLVLVGEILDVDGKIGGFNFQWAWSSAYVAARGLGRRPR